MSARIGHGHDGTLVITGGAGFIGSNLAHHWLTAGARVVLLDTLTRPGVRRNLEWLERIHGDRVRLAQVDIRDATAVRGCLRSLHHEGLLAGVFHLAAQVAVTSSIVDPLRDFAVNAAGTLHLLEALRELPSPPPLIYTSTNKVYGCLAGLQTVRRDDRYEPADAGIAARGIDEHQPLDFQSPYGCSKGAADQYVLEYARTYGLPATVFRMSCIYGPHQFGTEDQGWIAHFMVRALAGEAVTIYGDGCQVRDALYVDDLVAAFRLAFDALVADDRAAPVRGRAFNIGGGPEHTLSLLELLDLIAEQHGRRPDVRAGAWRAGDQRYYVSDSRAFARATGWRPRIGVREGVSALYRWLAEGEDTAPAGAPGHESRQLPARALAHEGAAALSAIVARDDAPPRGDAASADRSLHGRETTR